VKTSIVTAAVVPDSLMKPEMCHCLCSYDVLFTLCLDSVSTPGSKRTQDETVAEKCVINSLKNVTKLLTVEITSVAKVKGD
jgi:hypothetical protein